MARNLLVPLESIDYDCVIAEGTGLDYFLPQRGHMRQIDQLLKIDKEAKIAVAVRNIRDDEFWCDGHFPGWPVLPGVVMIEALAQLCLIYWLHEFDPEGRLLLFAGVDDVKFRGSVHPGERLTIMQHGEHLRFRASKFKAQAVNEKGSIVCSATIRGVLGPVPPKPIPGYLVKKDS